jgi:5-methyltetrahydrofolate--homocysteine methyltransferase
MSYDDALKIAERGNSAGRFLIATVKGDVHDIGKNIVGVVLSCNGFEVTDMGVMVSCDKILDRAIEMGSDVIGLSGLITPSLDEMVHVAKEMERRGFTIPLLIGGATTSAAHTAIKIAEHYSGPVVHVLDASRSVPVTTSLLSKDGRDAFVVDLREKQQKARENFLGGPKKETLTIEAARAAGPKFDWDSYTPPVPSFTGTKTIEVEIGDLVEYIDWTPFFHAWELRGVWDREAKVLKTRNEGGAAEAKKLYAEACEYLEKLVKEKRLQARGIYGFFPANSDGDDITVFNEDGSERTKFHTIRQQLKKTSGKPNVALSDWVKPRSGDLRSPQASPLTPTFLNPEDPIKKSKTKNLPHWSQENATYAVTFRLADSLPKSVTEEYATEKRMLSAIISKAEAEGEETTATDARKKLESLYSEKMEEALEQGHGECHMRRKDIAVIVRDAILRYAGERFELGAWCVMPNHVHLLIQPKEGFPLSEILQGMKAFSAKMANRLLGLEGTFWQRESYDHIIRDGEDYAWQRNYVLSNPGKAGLVGWEFVDEWRPKVTTTSDYIGGFVVGIHGADEYAKELDDANDPYGSIMVKAIADRLAEACTEKLHHQARIEWGYEAEGELATDALIHEKYQGIRPAPGYPAQPDHTEKPILFDLLGATDETGVYLTESCAMHPGAAVCGLYFSHPESHYFALSELQKDQVEDYAKRKGMTLAEAEKWLGPWLGYVTK